MWWSTTTSPGTGRGPDPDGPPCLPLDREDGGELPGGQGREGRGVRPGVAAHLARDRQGGEGGVRRRRPGHGPGCSPSDPGRPPGGQGGGGDGRLRPRTGRPPGGFGRPAPGGAGCM